MRDEESSLETGTMSRPGYGFRRLRSERLTKDGAVIVTHNQLVLLHGLLDRPDAACVSYVDWVRASIPYMRRFQTAPNPDRLFRSIHRLPDSWVTRMKIGRGVRCQLTLRGRSLLDRSLPAHVMGHGTYCGMKALAAQ